MPSLKENGKRVNGKRSGHWIHKATRLAIYLRDDFSCSYCGNDLSTANRRDVHLDHLKPRSKGGEDLPRNLVTACGKCNSKRQDRPWRQYATGGAVARIERQVRRRLNLDLARALIAGSTGTENS